jgi:uncharacterized protein (TIGR02145 family)
MKVLIGFLFLFSISLTFSQLYTPGSGVSDIDGNNYSTININGQEWMAENLRTTTYANGNPIPNVTDSAQWSSLTTGAWTHYNNDNQYENPYGKLYNWYTVADTRNVCPTGWHVPTDAEYTLLTDYLGGEPVAGGKMKEAGTSNWASPNTGATNSSGFTGLPGGYLNGEFIFLGISAFGYWWSSSAESNISYYAWSRRLDFINGEALRADYTKQEGLSVRCMRESTSGLNLINPSQKKLVKILNIMGQETTVKTNEILFYLFDDGSIERKITVD